MNAQSKISQVNTQAAKSEPERVGYTPGPVRAAIAVLKELKLYENASGGCIAMLSAIIAKETAAPDLLTACQSVWLMLANTGDNELRLIADEAREAIAKATGGVS